MALGGCSAIKLGYATLPELAYWWLDGYVDFDDVQRLRVREDLARLHAWHRASELPRLLPLLQQAEQLAPGDVSAEQACAFEAPVRERIAALRDQAEPALTTTAITLSDAQLRHLERKYAQKNRDYAKEWIDIPRAEQADKRLKELLGRADTVYGSLTETQRTMLARLVQGSAWNPSLLLAERRRRQHDTLAVLRRLTAQPGPALHEARQAVHELLERYLTSPDPTFRAYVDVMRQEACRITSALHNSTSTAQRDFAARRLRGWQRDIGELAAQQ